MKKGHANSNIVTLKWKTPLHLNDKDPEVREWMESFKVSIGSYFNKSGRGNASGLTETEVKLLLPSVVNVSSNDLTFRKAVSHYYGRISTRIPAIGLPLEIGLELDNDKELTYSKKIGEEEVFNFPINIDDYLTYRHAIAHPYTRLSEEEAKADPTCLYYIDDPKDQTDKQNKTNEMQDEAMAAYLQAKKDKKTVDMVLRLLGHNLKDIPKEERVVKLKQAMDKDLVKFIKTATDPELVAKYEITQMVSHGVLEPVGTSPRYLDGTSKQELAVGIKDMLLFMKDKGNSETVGLLKARLQEALKGAKTA